jgi:ATP-dependent DNA helicase RecQ
LEEIKRYVEHTGYLMEFLSRALDDPAAAPCGKCMNCTGKTKRASVPPALVQAAVDFLRHDALVLEPRIWWPKPALGELDKVLPGALERYESGKPKMVIPERLRAQAGRVLCMYGDAGWGHEVARGKYQTGVFSEALVTAAAELIQSKWKPDPPPQWVTAIPSRRHTELMRDFAQRLAASLGLPFVPALRQCRETQPQKEMRSSTLQLRNVLRAFEVAEAPAMVPSEAQTAPRGLTRMFQQVARRVGARFGNGPTLPPVPVLLVDDMVDSGWTLTLAAVLLQHQGSGPVYPFALAKASPRGS